MKSTLFLTMLGIGMVFSLAQAQPMSVLGDDEIFLIVKGQKAECMGVAPMECLQVKTSLEQPEWENFSAKIEGFDWKEGESTLLKVKTTKIDHPPADAPNIHYQLIETVVIMPSINENE